MSEDIYFAEEHRMLRAQVRRFVEEEVRPHGHLFGRRPGMGPRERLPGAMGALGFRPVSGSVGLRVAREREGIGASPHARCLAEELGPLGIRRVSPIHRGWVHTTWPFGRIWPMPATRPQLEGLHARP